MKATHRSLLPSGLPASRGAFTIVEIVMVVVIMAIMAGIAVPRFSGSIAHHRVEAAARRIAADLALARQRAIETNVTQTLAFNVVNDSYQNAGMQDINNPGITYQISLSEEPYRATILSANLGGDSSVVFDIYGKPDSGGTVVVEVGAWQKTITLDVETGKTAITG